MNYFQVINDSLDYIESQIRRPLSLDQLAERAHLSRYHFLRIFKALTNITPKDYIDGRKLTEASVLLRRGVKIVDIALEYGFQSHEVFTRRYKQFFGITPSEARRGHGTEFAQERMVVAERDFTNNNNKLYPSFKLEYLPNQCLLGQTISFDPADMSQLRDVSRSVTNFVGQYSKVHSITKLYGVVFSSTKAESVQYYAGFETDASAEPGLEALTLPASDYAVFSYKGSLGSLYDTVFADVCTALLLSNRQFNRTKIELFEVYGDDYAHTGRLSIYIPVK